MSRQIPFSQSLAFKLTFPALIIGACTFTLIVVLMTVRSGQVLEEIIDSETESILETLVIASEANATLENLQSVVYNLASKNNVLRLSVVNGSTGEVISDSKQGTRRQHYSDTFTADQSQLFSSILTNSDKFHIIQQNDAVVHFEKILLIDPSVNRLRPHWFMLEFDVSTIQSQARTSILSIAITFIFGLIITLGGVYWVQQRLLIKPLNQFVDTVNKGKGESLLNIEHKRKDELGSLANAYNQLVKSNKKRHLEISAHIEALDFAMQEADLANRAKSSFLASMSHEIRTPLNGVLGMINLLEKTPINENQKHKLSVARSSGESLLVIINDILDFSKIEAGKMELDSFEFDLREMLGVVAETMSLRAQEKSVELILDCTEVSESYLKGDVTRVRQIITNLVGNAVKFTDKGEIEICAKLTTLENGRRHLSCAIRDTGIGIPQEKIPELFSTFSQVDASTTRQYGGTGLGLAISKRLCELMGGDILVSSEINKGSTFTAQFVLEAAENSEQVLPPKQHTHLHTFVFSANQTLANSIASQLHKWNITNQITTSFEEFSKQLTALANLSSNKQSEKSPNKPQKKVAAYIDASMFTLYRENLAKLFNSNSEVDCQKVLMTTLDDTTDVQTLSLLGFKFAFPKPVTTKNLLESLSAIHQEKETLSSTSRFYKKEEQASKPTTLKTFEHSRLLLVEDNPVNQEVITGMLNVFNIQPEVANDGKEAIDKLVNTPIPFDLIIMDCQMPIMDGYETSTYIRSNDKCAAYAHIPIVALTANAMSGDREKCIAAGMSDYLSKPIDPEQLYGALRRWLGEDSIHAGEKETTMISSQSNDQTWDKNSALARVRNKEERLQRLVDLFLKDMPERMEELQLATSNGDIKHIQEVAHTIKGVAGNLSTQNFMEAAATVETACREERTDDIETMVQELSQQYDQAAQALESYLGR